MIESRASIVSFPSTIIYYSIGRSMWLGWEERKGTICLSVLIYTYIVRWLRDTYHIEHGNTIEIYIDIAILYAIDEYYSRDRNTIDRSRQDHRVPFDYKIVRWCPMNRHPNLDHNSLATNPNKRFQVVWVFASYDDRYSTTVSDFFYKKKIQIQSISISWCNQYKLPL